MSSFKSLRLSCIYNVYNIKSDEIFSKNGGWFKSVSALCCLETLLMFHKRFELHLVCPAYDPIWGFEYLKRALEEKKKRGSIKILEHVFSLRQKLIYCRPHLLSHVTWHRIRVNLPPMATISLSPVQTHDVVLIALSYVLAVLLGTTPHTPLNS